MNVWDTPHTLALIDLALEEDLGRGDVTSLATIAPEHVGRAALVARQPLVVAGLPVAAQVCRRVSSDLTLKEHVADGTHVTAGTTLGVIAGPVQALLGAERTALNFLQRLSGVATTTSRHVQAAGQGGARIVDTRKTTPGYRALEKYAVRMGGGGNHRFDLGSGVLIKDNHIAAGGSLRQAVERARSLAPHGLKIEVEVDTLAQFDEALSVGADIVLLDNFSMDDIRTAVGKRQAHAGLRPLLEVSGGVKLENVGALAGTGVDLISVGALTHSAAAVDIGLDYLSA